MTNFNGDLNLVVDLLNLINTKHHCYHTIYDSTVLCLYNDVRVLKTYAHIDFFYWGCIKNKRKKSDKEEGDDNKTNNLKT